MENPFEEYISTVQELVALEGKSELASYINVSNIQAVWVNHENWNGGIDYYDLVIDIPTKVFARIRPRLKEEEDALYQAFADATHGMNDSIRLTAVKIVPNNKASTSGISVSSNDASMWKYNYYRLFISHLSEDKARAASIKPILEAYGIDCFVAHEDISPSKEWQVVIENALSTMDVLCAILTPNFINSQWCDQEVGYALGRGKIVIPIDKGAVPYGFIGKWQAIHSQGKSRVEVARAILDAICINEHTRGAYFERLINLIIVAKTQEEASHFLEVLSGIKDIEKRYVEFLHSHYAENAVLMETACLRVSNALFEQNGLSKLIKKVQMSSLDEINNDLPF